MTGLATYSRSGAVGTIVMDDGKANVMSLAMLNALHAAFDQAEKDKTVGPAEAVTAGFFDRVVASDALEQCAEEAAQALSTLNMTAYAATKARARGTVIKLIRSMIDEDITPQYGEDRVKNRASA